MSTRDQTGLNMLKIVHASRCTRAFFVSSSNSPQKRVFSNMRVNGAALIVKNAVFVKNIYDTG
jgi:hypothetical protein